MTLDYATNELTLRRPAGGPKRALDKHEIAFQWASAEGSLVVVPVFVNEKGPYDFALDTGASSTVISLELAAEFGLATEKTSQLTAGGGNGIVSRVQRAPSGVRLRRRSTCVDCGGTEGSCGETLFPCWYHEQQRDPRPHFVET